MVAMPNLNCVLLICFVKVHDVVASLMFFHPSLFESTHVFIYKSMIEKSCAIDGPSTIALDTSFLARAIK